MDASDRLVFSPVIACGEHLLCRRQGQTEIAGFFPVALSDRSRRCSTNASARPAARWLVTAISRSLKSSGFAFSGGAALIFSGLISKFECENIEGLAGMHELIAELKASINWSLQSYAKDAGEFHAPIAERTL